MARQPVPHLSSAKGKRSQGDEASPCNSPTSPMFQFHDGCARGPDARIANSFTPVNNRFAKDDDVDEVVNELSGMAIKIPEPNYAAQLAAILKPPPIEAPALSLMNLPNEILVKVIEATVAHPSPIPVNAKFESIPTNHNGFYPAADYRILHTCKRAYQAGINAYFSLNTWAIDLELFRHEPDTFCGPLDDPLVDSWPYGTGHGIQAQEVHRVVLTSQIYHAFQDSARLLRGFHKLEYVGFDLRLGLYHEEWDDLAKVEATPEMKALLVRGGVDLTDDARVEVADLDEPEAERKMHEWLMGNLEDGIAAWEKGSRRPFFARKRMI